MGAPARGGANNPEAYEQSLPATQVFPLFHVAEWVPRWIVIASVIGFPSAVIFSWFYEWTPQGFQLESVIRLTSKGRYFSLEDRD